MDIRKVIKFETDIDPYRAQCIMLQTKGEEVLNDTFELTKCELAEQSKLIKAMDTEYKQLEVEAMDLYAKYFKEAVEAQAAAQCLNVIM